MDEFNDRGYNVSIQDVATVKFFPQSFRLGEGLNDDGNKLSNYSFYVKDYTQKNAVLK